MKDTIDKIVEQAGGILLGKQRQVRLALACLLSKGHLIIEDLPGIGKTTLAQVLARVLNLDFNRIQFTSDLLPADILGVSVYDRHAGTFIFHSGPIFSQLVLADEVNRATPKTQSALLEAMEERQVTVEGETRPLPRPFFVIATQNPEDQVGTFPLPESQIDRFLMRIELGYPDHESERRLLKGRDRRELIERIDPILDADDLLALQEKVHEIHASEALLDYVQNLVEYTRSSSKFHVGLSPRAGMALLRCAKAWALMEGRDSVVPEDVQAVMSWVVKHRVRPSMEAGEIPRNELIELLQKVPVP